MERPIVRKQESLQSLMKVKSKGSILGMPRENLVRSLVGWIQIQT
jgi:Na+/citrate or Na+/malate symporter